LKLRFVNIFQFSSKLDQQRTVYEGLQTILLTSYVQMARSSLITERSKTGVKRHCRENNTPFFVQ